MKSFFKILFVSIFVTVSLAGCGHGASSGASESDQSGFGSVLTWAKKIVHGFGITANYQVPMFTLISDSLLTGAGADGGNFKGAGVRELIVYEPGGVDKAIKALDADFILAMKAAKSDSYHIEKTPYLISFAAITAPYLGWQVDPMSNLNGGKVTKYLGYQEVSAELANRVYNKIAHDVSNYSDKFSDPDAAKKVIVDSFNSIPNETLESWLTEAIQNAMSRGRTVDLTGSNSVHWSATDGGDYNGDRTGLVWSKAGGKWFGDGAINGKSWSVALESKTSTSSEKGSSGEESVRGSSGSSVNSNSR